MTLSELVVKLTHVTKEADAAHVDPEVFIRLPKGMGFTKAKVTQTYVSQSRDGTTFYDQVPAVLFEEDTGD